MKPKYLKHIEGEHGRYWHLWRAGDVLVGLPDHYFPEGFVGPVNAYHPETFDALSCYLPDNYWDDLFVKQPPSQVIPEPVFTKPTLPGASLGANENCTVCKGTGCTEEYGVHQKCTECFPDVKKEDQKPYCFETSLQTGTFPLCGLCKGRGILLEDGEVRGCPRCSPLEGDDQEKLREALGALVWNAAQGGHRSAGWWAHHVKGMLEDHGVLEPVELGQDDGQQDQS